MLTSIPSNNPRPDRNSDFGFSLLEMVVAASLLTIGLMAVASALGYAMMAGNYGRAITNTKLLAVSMLEQMETLRNTGHLTFDQIANVGQVDSTGATRAFGGFPPGPQQVSTEPGPDGIFGTADDLTDAGNDNQFGTPDDFINPAFAVVGVTRQIQITSLDDTLKRVDVTINYPASGQMRQLVVSSYLGDIANSNFTP